jgi:hypothetical protein
MPTSNVFQLTAEFLNTTQQFPLRPFKAEDLLNIKYLSIQAVPQREHTLHHYKTKLLMIFKGNIHCLHREIVRNPCIDFM